MLPDKDRQIGCLVELTENMKFERFRMQIRNLLSFQRPFKSPQQKVAVLMMPSIVAALVIVNVTRLFLPSEKDSEWDVGTTQSKELSRLPSVGGFFDCDRDSMKPSPSDPDDVNKVRPADIKSIGALGDSITAGYKSKNFDYEPDGTYMGNSFITGADEPLEQHATIANILRKFNPNLEGLSYSIPAERAGFNVAFPGANSSQLPTQAETLVELFRKEEPNLSKSWKLIFIFIGTNDAGSLRCHYKADYVSGEGLLSRVLLKKTLRNL
ncbi:hypothetical protein ANCCEY_07233 [Ancylostoma ceylanicum]|uniref:Uncharacterized protein n=1 Tax=Ancylostoma ceylanicum TaxID=53326 RepID=A0A0D6LUD9_9BILA|nr:hypothetical protein ANCCEY_07233 [Ancylostoma ceylanicum]